MTPIMVSASSGNGYTRHPPGQFPAVCGDVVDLGWISMSFGLKRRIRLIFFCGEYVERTVDGEKRLAPLYVSAFFNASLHEKASLRSFLEGWRGLQKL